MHTENHITIRGSIGRIYELAAEVTRWPEILPHYRWVKLLDKEGRKRTVEMAATRDGIPVKWMAIQTLVPEENRILFRHIEGPTTGMDVEWTLVQRGDEVDVTIRHDFESGIPVIGALVSRYVVGQFFVHNIAGKTLGRIKRIVESEAGTDES